MAARSAVTIKPVMHHVTFKTTRLQAMIDWYAAVVGVDVNYQFPGGAWTSNDRANHRIAFLTIPGFEDDAEKITRTGMHHTAFEYTSFNDLMASYARLKDIGIEPDACLNHGLTTSIYYSDPDQNMVELQVDNFGDWERSSQWMRNAPEFRANPIGVFFDPDMMLAAHNCGASFSQILEASYAGKYPPSKTPDLRLP